MAQPPARDPVPARPATPSAANPAKPARAAVGPAAVKQAPPKPGIAKAGPTVPAVAARAFRAAPRRGFTLTAEHGLAVTGIAIAVASGCFGIYMNVRPEQQFAGSKYWTVFAQLARGGQASPPSGQPGGPGIDPVATGSIPAGSAPAAGRNSPAAAAPPPAEAPVENKRAGAPLKGYVVRDVFDGMALVESPYGLTLVKPGAVLLGAGQVTGIEMRAGKWVVLTSQGIIATAAN